MKLSHLTLSLIGLAGIASLGGSYFTGKQLEQRYPEFIAQSNQQLKGLEANGIQAQIKEVKFERHLFTSDTQYVLEVNIEGETFLFEGKDKIYHGPFPLNRLRQGNPIPVALSADSQLHFPDTLKTLLNGQEQLFSTHVNLSYSGNLRASLTSQPITHTKLEIAPISVNYDGDLLGKGESQAHIPALKVIGQAGILEVKNIRYQAKLEDDHGLPALRLGTISAQAENATIYNPISENRFTYQQIDLMAHNTLSGERYESKLDLTVANTVVSAAKGDIQLGKLNTSFLLESDAKLTNDFPLNFGQAQQTHTHQAVEMWQDLAKKGFKLHINPIKFSHPQGELALQLVVNSKPFEQINLNQFAEIIALLQHSYFKLKIDLPVVKELLSQLAQSDGLDPQTAQQQSERLIAELKQQMMQTNIVQIDDNQISTNLDVNDGKVMLNGRTLSKSEIQSALFMLMFGLGKF